MAKVELKQPVVNEIKELLTDAQSAVLVSYRGITVEQDTAMRKELREADVEYKVYKNTMIRFARILAGAVASVLETAIAVGPFKSSANASNSVPWIAKRIIVFLYTLYSTSASLNSLRIAVSCSTVIPR